MGLTVDLGPLRASKPFRRLWVGRAFAGLGSQLTLVAVLHQVWQATGSTLWTGAVGLAQAVPLIGLGMFAGALVDRVDRRKFYLVTLTGQAACSVLLAVQAFLDVPVVVVLALVAVQSCFVAGGGPAARTFAPRLLPADQLAAGLALQRISFQGAMLLGPALGGLLGWVGVGGCYLVDVATFGIAFLGAFGLPAMLPGGEPARPGVRGVLDGLRFLLGHATVRGALLTDLATMVLSMPISLFPLVNAERFGDDPRTLGLFLSAVAVGGVVASVFSGTFTRLPRQGVVMLAGSSAWGVAMVLFGFAANPWLALGALVLAGAADTVSVVSRGAIVQLNTPDELMGRVAAAEVVVGQAGPDVGNLRAGLVAHATSGTAALVSGGVLCVAVVAAVAAFTPGLRKHAYSPSSSSGGGA
ncbi:MFS transporter [Actinokineospora sp. PR83]|uniref:MFS transporter n=1 Tax=Actinokineospora sp. PR83 TaxID=2884908 RepID=UPI0027DEBEB0|nr:MFS transporter [Actinokineospora sp. PR83]MCG8915103.1 MFS transporter [Actinokineospora sp. PR83]